VKIFLVLALSSIAVFPIAAQSLIVSHCEGSAILFKANATTVKARQYYPAGFGDIIATGNGGSAELATTNGFRASLGENTVVIYCYSGPLASARGFIELVSGAMTISDSGSGTLSPSLRVEEQEQRATQNAVTLSMGISDINSLMERILPIRAELDNLESLYEKETANLAIVNAQYRDILASGSETDAADFRKSTLYPAQDERSLIVGEIAYRETFFRAIRLFVLAPLYMKIKSMNPYLTDESSETIARLASHSRILDHSLRYSSSNSSEETGLPK
jgi:hypothetical protein